WELLKLLVEPKTPRATVARYASSAGSSIGVLRTGAQWSEMPRKYPPYQTCHCRLQQWVRQGVLVKVLRTLAQDMRARGQLDLAEMFIDATFSGAKKGVCCWSNTPRRSGSVLCTPQGDRQRFRLPRSESGRACSARGWP